MSFRVLAVSLLLSCLTPLAQATVIWDFDIVNPHATVGQNEAVSFIGRLQNSAESTEALQLYVPCGDMDGCPIQMSVMTWSYGPNFASLDTGFSYEYTFPDLATKLQPGESVSFEFLTLTPTSTAAPFGTYVISSTLNTRYGSAQTRSVAIDVVPAPLPAAGLSLASALSVLIAFRRKMRDR